MYDRVVALILLFVATIVPTAMVEFVVRPEIQLLMGTFIVLYLILKDAIAGFIAGTALLILYFRVYAEQMGVSIQQVLGLNLSSIGNMWIPDPSTKQMPHITPEHLRSAQDNVVNPNNFDAEMTGVRGVYGEEVYGAQGMNKTMPGYAAALGGEVA